MYQFNCFMFNIYQPYKVVLFSITFLQAIGNHGCLNFNPLHLADTQGIWNISNYYLCHLEAWQKKCGYDTFLHLVNETNTVVAFMNESSHFMTHSLWERGEI